MSPRVPQVELAGRRVSALALGDGGLLARPLRESWRARREVVRSARALGITFFDTAVSYALGLDERWLGWLPDRHDLFVATKAGLPTGPRRLLGGRARRFDPAYLIRHCRRSRRRLRRRTLDLFYLHGPPDEVVGDPDHPCWRALAALADRGWIALSGVSLAPGATVLPSPAQVDVVQIPLTAPAGLIERARQEGLAVVLRQPFVSSSETPPPARMEQLARRYPGIPILFATRSGDHLRANVEGYLR